MGVQTVMPFARRWACGTLGSLASALLATGTAGAQALPPEAEQAPPPDCTAAVEWNQNATPPGYVVPDDVRGTTCVPFTQVPLAPAGYQGDYRVQEFSDAVLRRMLAQCEVQPPCAAIAAAKNYDPPQFRLTGLLVPEGRIDPLADDVDLREIRRPAFFGRAPYRTLRDAIAASPQIWEASTQPTFETAP